MRGTHRLAGPRRGQRGTRGLRLRRAGARLGRPLLLLVLLLFAGLDGLESGLDVVHDPPDGDFAAWIGVRGDALLNHVEEILACCCVSSVVRALGGGLRRAKEGGEA